jgi:oxaloacetate decarboxylase gamma subunit
MTILDMLGQSAVLTVLGIGVVFSFLIIMIICLTLVHKLVQALKLDVEKTAGSPASVSEDKNAIVAAIASAIRNKKA